MDETSTLGDVVELLEGVAQILMRIDANLVTIVEFLGGGDEEADT